MSLLSKKIISASIIKGVVEGGEADSFQKVLKKEVGSPRAPTLVLVSLGHGAHRPNVLISESTPRAHGLKCL